jgi:hypothetical protein
MADGAVRRHRGSPPTHLEDVVKKPAIATLALATALSLAGMAGASAHGRAAPGVQERGSAGHWTKVSVGTVGSIDQPSLARTANGDLHLVYALDSGSAIHQTALHTNGTVFGHSNVLTTSWADVVADPMLVSEGGSDLRVLFGGLRTTGTGFYDQGRMYTATSSSAGGSGWVLGTDAATISHSAYGSYGTAAVTLADGTPIAGFPLNSDLTWHVGLGDGTPDQVHHSSQCCLYDASFVRDGNTVWAGWYENGSTAATNGFFAMRIYPTTGSVTKAPGSSVGASSIPWLTRTAMAARAGGGAYMAYCVGYPTCKDVRVWEVGTKHIATVPHSKNAETIAMSAAPSGRLWIAWSDSNPKVHAVRTGTNGLAMGAVQTPGLPVGAGSAYSLAIDGTRGRGDIVVNVGNAIWHTQVLPGLTLHASPQRWHHGASQKVTFSVSDAHAAVKGAKVKVGTSACTTTSKGTCSISFPRTFGQGKHTARASRSGYAAATTGLRVT